MSVVVVRAMPQQLGMRPFRWLAKNSPRDLLASKGWRAHPSLPNGGTERGKSAAVLFFFVLRVKAVSES